MQHLWKACSELQAQESKLQNLIVHAPWTPLLSLLSIQQSCTCAPCFWSTAELQKEREETRLQGASNEQQRSMQGVGRRQHMLPRRAAGSLSGPHQAGEEQLPCLLKGSLASTGIGESSACATHQADMQHAHIVTCNAICGLVLIHYGTSSG